MRPGTHSYAMEKKSAAMSVPENLPFRERINNKFGAIYRDRCVAGNCSSHRMTSGNFILHRFPTESSLREKWFAFVRQLNPAWTWNTKHYLCCDHFTDDSYVNSMSFKMGFSDRLILKKGALPTIQKQPKPQINQDDCVQETTLQPNQSDLMGKRTSPQDQSAAAMKGKSQLNESKSTEKSTKSQSCLSSPDKLRRSRRIQSRRIQSNSAQKRKSKSDGSTSPQKKKKSMPSQSGSSRKRKSKRESGRARKRKRQNQPTVKTEVADPLLEDVCTSIPLGDLDSHVKLEMQDEIKEEAQDNFSYENPNSIVPQPCQQNRYDSIIQALQETLDPADIKPHPEDITLSDNSQSKPSVSDTNEAPMTPMVFSDVKPIVSDTSEMMISPIRFSSVKLHPVASELNQSGMATPSVTSHEKQLIPETSNVITAHASSSLSSIAEPMKSQSLPVTPRSSSLVSKSGDPVTVSKTQSQPVSLLLISQAPSSSSTTGANPVTTFIINSKPTMSSSLSSKVKSQLASLPVTPRASSLLPQSANPLSVSNTKSKQVTLLVIHKTSSSLPKNVNTVSSSNLKSPPVSCGTPSQNLSSLSSFEDPLTKSSMKSDSQSASLLVPPKETLSSLSTSADPVTTSIMKSQPASLLANGSSFSTCEVTSSTQKSHPMTSVCKPNTTPVIADTSPEIASHPLILSANNPFSNANISAKNLPHNESELNPQGKSCESLIATTSTPTIFPVSLLVNTANCTVSSNRSVKYDINEQATPISSTSMRVTDATPPVLSSSTVSAFPTSSTVINSGLSSNPLSSSYQQQSCPGATSRSTITDVSPSSASFTSDKNVTNLIPVSSYGGKVQLFRLVDSESGPAGSSTSKSLSGSYSPGCQITSTGTVSIVDASAVTSSSGSVGSEICSTTIDKNVLYQCENAEIPAVENRIRYQSGSVMKEPVTSLTPVHSSTGTLETTHPVVAVNSHKTAIPCTPTHTKAKPTILFVGSEIDPVSVMTSNPNVRSLLPTTLTRSQASGACQIQSSTAVRTIPTSDAVAEHSCATISDTWPSVSSLTVSSSSPELSITNPQTEGQKLPIDTTKGLNHINIDFTTISEKFPTNADQIKCVFSSTRDEIEKSSIKKPVVKLERLSAAVRDALSRNSSVSLSQLDTDFRRGDSSSVNIAGLTSENCGSYRKEDKLSPCVSSRHEVLPRKGDLFQELHGVNSCFMAIPKISIEDKSVSVSSHKNLDFSQGESELPLVYDNPMESCDETSDGLDFSASRSDELLDSNKFTHNVREYEQSNPEKMNENENGISLGLKDFRESSKELLLDCKDSKDLSTELGSDDTCMLENISEVCSEVRGRAEGQESIRHGINDLDDDCQETEIGLNHEEIMETEDEGSKNLCMVVKNAQVSLTSQTEEMRKEVDHRKGTQTMETTAAMERCEDMSIMASGSTSFAAGVQYLDRSAETCDSADATAETGHEDLRGQTDCVAGRTARVSYEEHGDVGGCQMEMTVEEEVVKHVKEKGTCTNDLSVASNSKTHKSKSLVSTIRVGEISSENKSIVEITEDLLLDEMAFLVRVKKLLKLFRTVGKILELLINISDELDERRSFDLELTGLMMSHTRVLDIELRKIRNFLVIRGKNATVRMIYPPINSFIMESPEISSWDGHSGTEN